MVPGACCGKMVKYADTDAPVNEQSPRRVRRRISYQAFSGWYSEATRPDRTSFSFSEKLLDYRVAQRSNRPSGAVYFFEEVKAVSRACV